MDLCLRFVGVYFTSPIALLHLTRFPIQLFPAHRLVKLSNSLSIINTSSTTLQLYYFPTTLQIMADLENNSLGGPILRPESYASLRKFTRIEDIEGQNVWLTVVVVFCFCLTVSSLTKNLGHVFSVTFAVATAGFYSCIVVQSRKRILLCCVAVGLGISLMHVSQTPVAMEYCKVQQIRIPTQFSNSTTGSELALHVCVSYGYSFSTPPDTNTSKPVSTFVSSPSQYPFQTL